MPYYYKREINDLSGTGKKVFRYEIRSEGVASLSHLAYEVHKRYRALGEGEVEGILMTFLDVVKAALAEGRTVSLEDFGSFSLGIGLKDEDSMVTVQDHCFQIHRNEIDGHTHTSMRIVRAKGGKANKWLKTL